MPHSRWLKVTAMAMHNRSMKVAVQGPVEGLPLIHSFITAMAHLNNLTLAYMFPSYVTTGCYNAMFKSV
jgi:hypothetical protein